MAMDLLENREEENVLPDTVLTSTTKSKKKGKGRFFQISQVKFHPLSAGIFTVFGLRLLECRVLHKRAWFATLLGTSLGSRTIKRSNFHVQYRYQRYLKD